MDNLVNFGKGTQPKTERNLALKRDYLAGMDMVNLVTKYKISSVRIYNILKSMDITPSRRQKDK